MVGEDSTNIKELEATVLLPLADLTSGKGNYMYFFGPNEFATCKSVTEGFEENVNLGWPVIKWINRFVVIPVFNFLASKIANYGIIIVILFLLLKLLLFQLSYGSDFFSIEVFFALSCLYSFVLSTFVISVALITPIF